MESKMCQVAACLIPKFKLNWVVEDNQNEVKNTFMENIIDNSLTISSSQENNLQSTFNKTIELHYRDEFEDDFLVLRKIIF